MSKCKSNRSITCEPLEDRRMFVTYQVTGTSGPDAISISISGNSIISAVNGVSGSASDIVNNTIEINGLGGNDTISITETGNNFVNVFSGAGDDTINIGNGDNDLDNVIGQVTVNGESGSSDDVILFDQNTSSATPNFTFDGNQIARFGSAPIVTTNVETVTVNSAARSTLFFEATPATTNLILNAQAGFQNSVALDGSNTEAATFTPSGNVQRAGRLTFDGAVTDYTGIVSVVMQSLDSVTMTTPNSSDTLTLASAGASLLTVNGNSGGLSLPQMSLHNVGTLTLATGTFDSAGSVDTITATGGLTGVSTLALNVGGGTNTFTANSGIWAMQLPASATSLDLIANNATINFATSTSVHRIELNNSGTVGLTFQGVLLNVNELAVVNGTGTLNLTGFSSVNVPVGGSFAIGANRTFIKDGLGQLNVSATQLHGNPANFENRAGTSVIHTEAGSSTTRRLNVKSVAGTLRLGSNQHLNNVTLDGGDVEIIPFGSRILVASSVSMTARGGSLNLNDNDLVVDVASANQFAGIRQLLASGYADGLWNGDGINSVLAQQNPAGNTTLGALTGSEWSDLYGSTPFDGQSVDSTSMLIKYTYYGDVDFNGSTDVSDYNLIDFGFVNHLNTWSFGDVDNNGTVDAGDYNLIDFAFTTQGAAL